MDHAEWCFGQNNDDFSRESISVADHLVAKNGIESMNCKLFEADHEDVTCENFDIVASNEICNGNEVDL